MMVMVEVMAKMKIKCSKLGKEEREKQNGLKAKLYLIEPFCFATQDTIKGVNGFRIDNCTIKRESV
jgi:hypothetical protein